MNYKHLHYFWTVARTGSIARASEQLHLTAQTLSGQIKLLEGRIGKPLLRKAGRGIELTDAGRTVQRYADEIFLLGSALKDALNTGHSGVARSTFRVGVLNSVPKTIAFHVLEPAMTRLADSKLVCQEGRLPELLGALAVHKLDLVVSDVPLPSSLSVKAYNHLLGRTGVSFFGAPALLKRAGYTLPRARKAFPDCIGVLPLLMPGADTALRPRMDAWLRAHGLTPAVVAEFDDGALTKAFGRQAIGVFAGPTVLENEIARQYGAVVLGHAQGLSEEFYAISIERRITHPAVAAITSTARRDLFH